MEEQAKYVALDCEMVGVGMRGTKSSLARVTLVNWTGDVIYDEFIQQEEIVTDYRTFVSGITAEDIENADLTRHECRDEVSKLIDGKIVIGHASN